MTNSRKRTPPLPRGANRELVIAWHLERIRWRHATGSPEAGRAWLEARDEYLRLYNEHVDFMKQILAPVCEPGHFSKVKEYV